MCEIYLFSQDYFCCNNVYQLSSIDIFSLVFFFCEAALYDLNNLNKYKKENSKLQLIGGHTYVLFP